MRKILFVVGALFCFQQGICQEKPRERSLVTYDPLFWKDKLNLDAGQSRKIRDINSTFYKQLMTVYKQDHDNRMLLRSKAEEQLTVRSEEIWKTLYPRQRKKWEKILNQNRIN